MPTAVQTRADSDLELLPRLQLIELVMQLRKSLQDLGQTLREIVDERDAARLLNELCHY